MPAASNSARVKICGIMTVEHARVAVASGADLIGLILAPSRRRVEVDLARAIAVAARESAGARGVEIVGVFVNESPATINELAGAIGLDRAQLSGHESRDDVAAIMVPLVKAIRFDDHPSEAAWIADSVTHAGRDVPLLIDAHVPGSYGGAGVVADWQRAAAIAQEREVWLAGGLTPENVGQAIAAVSPAAVDVSSGVETAGVKDARKITAFIDRARAMQSRY
jgi:phosphoribosylanthranilate isomerase